MGSIEVSSASPQVMSKSAEISKNRIEMEPVPWARHGVGPSREKLRWMENTPTPKALSATDAEISMTKKNGENWNRASKAMWPSTEKAEKPKKSSARAPNCTVFDVTAK